MQTHSHKFIKLLDRHKLKLKSKH